MRGSLLCLAVMSLGFLGTGVASAANACSSVGTLQDWVNDGTTGCTINGITFVYGSATPTSSGGGVTPTASNITMNFSSTLGPGGNDTGFTLGFGANANCTSPTATNFCAPSTGKADIELDYYVSSTTSNISDLYAAITGTAVGTNTSNTGVDSLTDQYATGCAKAPISACAGAVSTPLITINEANSGSTATGDVTFAATNAVSVLKDMQACSASGCGAPGLAGATDITSVVNAFSTSTVPEPRMLGFLGAGMFGLIVLSLRRRKQQQAQ